MPRKPRPARTIHYAEVVASLKAQNEALMILLATVRDVIRFGGDKLPAAVVTDLRDKIDATERAFWPEEE